jgi:hypothetical protein
MDDTFYPDTRMRHNMSGKFKSNVGISLNGMITKQVRLERRIHEIFSEFKMECDFHIPVTGGIVEHCLHKDNGNLKETVGGGYFVCSVEDCPIRDKA